MRGVLLVILALSTSCASRTIPPPDTGKELYRDLERLVTLSDSAGWRIDRLELDGMLEPALDSLCRVDTSTVSSLLDWLDVRINELGGPVEQAYEARGRDLDEVDELLEISRIRMLLAHAINHRSSDCPFWVPVEEDFRGEQIFDDRFLIFVATGGKGILVSNAGREDISFGGAGRLMFGRGFGERWAVYIGAEAGAVASFPRDADGGRSNLVLGIDGVVPLAVRYRFVNAYVEVEGGWFGHITEDEKRLDTGFHIGAAVGAQTTKQLWFFPGAGFAASYEKAGALHSIKVGFRVSAELGL